MDVLLVRAFFIGWPPLVLLFTRFLLPEFYVFQTTFIFRASPYTSFMNIDKAFQNAFTYDVDNDCYVSLSNQNEVVLYQVGDDYIVVTYSEEGEEILYRGEDLTEAMTSAVTACGGEV